MAVLERHWASRDLAVIVDEELAFDFTFALSETGQPLDISGYTFYFAAGSEWTNDTITVSNSEMVKGSSGLGVTDTVSIPLSTLDTDVEEGRYQYDLTADTGTDEVVMVRGTLTVYERQSAVPYYDANVYISGGGVYDVTRFGAIGDGATDDTAAIQAAINACSDNGGGVVHIPNKTFIVATASAPASGRFSGGNGTFLKLKQGVSIRGLGESSVIKVGDSAGDYAAIFMQDDDDTSDTDNLLDGIHIENICIDHNRTNIHASAPGSTTNPRMSILLTWAHRFVARGVTVKNFDGVVSIYASNAVPVASGGTYECKDFNIRECKWVDSGGASYNYDVSIINVYADGINIQDNTFRVYDNTKHGARTAIETHGKGGQVITGNYIQGGHTGVNVTGNSVDDTEGVIICDNVMNEMRRGINIYSNEYSTHTSGFGINGARVCDNVINISPLIPATSATRAGISFDNGDIERRLVGALDVSRNVIVFDDPSTAVMHADSGGIVMTVNSNQDDDDLIDCLSVKDNYIQGAYVSGMKFWGNISNASISGNTIVSPATGDKVVNAGIGAGSWAGIRFEGGDTASHNSEDVYITGNIIVQGAGTPNYAGYFAIEAGDTPFVWRGNTVSGSFATSDYGGTTNVTFDGMLLDELTDVGFYTYAGNPNTNLAAGKGSLCSDTTNGTLYINTDGASAWSAV